MYCAALHEALGVLAENLQADRALFVVEFQKLQRLLAGVLDAVGGNELRHDERASAAGASVGETASS